MSEQLAFAVDVPTDLDRLREQMGADWPHLARARKISREKVDRLRAALQDLVPEEASLVVFGSLARHEFTTGSDLDWTLLVDGRANPQHHDAILAVERRVQELGFGEPTPGGTFGSLTVSHDLIHRIGGDDDTNRNTTQRILLLLESECVVGTAGYQQVVENVLRRYIAEDLVTSGDSPYRVPRFLQNDVVRYWRTIAVDFAHKRRLREKSGWALRTIKLRMSRKLMYVAGLLSCYSCEFDFPGEQAAAPGAQETVLSHLMAGVHATPLDIVARTVLSYFGELSGCAESLFRAYDAFLGVLDDAEHRNVLKTLSPETAERNEVYEAARGLATEFQQALTEMFFDSRTPLADLTRRYGVF
jgi:predicted nucleotidyltransferase